MNNLNLISVTPSLGLEIKKQECKDKIIERLSELKLVDPKFKNSQDVLLLICNLTEHMIKDKKINKKDIVLDIFTILYNLNASEISIVDSQIEFLHQNNSIKKLSRFYLFCCSAYEYMFKKKKP